MAFYGGPQGATTVSPPTLDTRAKLARIDVADGATGFAAFVLPKDAFIVGIYTLCTGANATQTINVGFTNGGTDLLNAFAPNSTGYAVGGAATGTAVGTKLTADKTVYVKASLALTTPVLVKVEYYLPQQGMTF